ncbi:MAG: hypothetical protein ACLR02_11215 [Clostridium sp.]
MIVTETAKELALFLGIKEDSVISACIKKRSGKHTGYKIVKVERS